MPCDTIKTVGVKVSKMQLDTLELALESMGHYVYRAGNILTWGRECYDRTTGELRVTSQDRATKVIQAYGKQGVKELAKKYGCQFIQNTQNANKFTLLKRSF